MKLRFFLSRLSWPAFCLIMLLQRSPLVRYLVQLENSLMPRVQHIWTVAVGAFTVGAYNSVTGASGDLQFRGNFNDTTVLAGEELRLVIEVDGSGNNPEDWRMTDPLPEGVAWNWIRNAATATIAGTPTESGSWNVTVRAWQRDPMQGAEGTPLSFTITVDPLITQQPVAQEVNFGSSPQLSVTLGNPAGASYQWQKEDSENSGTYIDLDGENGPSLSIESATLNDTGLYRVVITKGEYQETSDPAMITVGSSIQTQPAGVAADWSGNAELSVVMVSPEGVTYQWQKQNADDLEVFDDIPGQTGATLSLPVVTLADAGNYRVVTTSGENVELSEIAALAINASPLQLWQDTFFEDPFSEDTALDKDLDDDGLINAVEFTFGLDPNAMQKEALVRTTQETIEGVIHAVYSFPALSGGSTTTVVLESNTTPDAAGWTTLVSGVDGVIIESTAEAYVVKLPADPRQFNRLRIIENEI